MALNEKQKRFANEYLIDLNASQAAIRAGYSAKTAGSQGERLLRNVEIKAYIQECNQKRQNRTEVTADRVIQEIARLAFLDIRKAFGEQGQLKAIHELDDDTAAAIAGIDIAELTNEGQSIGLIKKVKLSDKRGALELLLKHLGAGQPKSVTDHEAELRRLEIKKKRAEIEALKRDPGNQSTTADLLQDLIGRLPD